MPSPMSEASALMRFMQGNFCLGLGRNAGGSCGASPELGQLRHTCVRPEPLIDMAIRFRCSARLGPLRFHCGKRGLSSISLGGCAVSSASLSVAQVGPARQ